MGGGGGGAEALGAGHGAVAPGGGGADALPGIGGGGGGGAERRGGALASAVSSWFGAAGVGGGGGGGRSGLATPERTRTGFRPSGLGAAAGLATDGGATPSIVTLRAGGGGRSLGATRVVAGSCSVVDAGAGSGRGGTVDQPESTGSVSSKSDGGPPAGRELDAIGTNYTRVVFPAREALGRP